MLQTHPYFIIDINLNLNFEKVSNHREVNNSNRSDVTSLAEVTVA